MRRERLGG